ncbi:MAG: hypothetical protein ACKVVT_04295 [Dehalococcoidia bacterium]
MTTDQLIRKSVTTWVHLYTSGLPEEARDGRREEIAGDVWEQLRRGEQGAVVTRCLRGVPDDLTWRLAHTQPARPFLRAAGGAWGLVGGAGRWSVRRGFPGLAFGMAALYVLIGAVLLISLIGGEAATRGDRFVGGTLLLISGGFVYGGWELIAQRRWLGLGAMLVGSVPWALGFNNGGVLPVITTVVIVGALLRMRSSGKAASRG